MRGDDGDAYGGRCVGVEEVGGVVPELRAGDLVELECAEAGEMPGESVEVPAVLDDGRGGSALLAFGGQEFGDGVGDRCHVVLLVVVSADAAREFVFSHRPTHFCLGFTPQQCREISPDGAQPRRISRHLF